MNQYLRDIRMAVEAVPGVRETALSCGTPLQGTCYGMPMQVANRPLVDRANREIVLQAIRRSIAGADRFALVSDNGGAGGGPASHPAVQAAIAQFGGEVVAVRPRSREGEGQ